MSPHIGLPRQVDMGWAAGKTFQEPNLIVWEDSTTGMSCCAIRDERGYFWTGYVAVQNNHPCFGLTVEELPKLLVHGGVSFSVQKDYLHWIGFHCCHVLDIAPNFGRGKPNGIYRNLEYVTAQCASLAKQLRNYELSLGGVA